MVPLPPPFKESWLSNLSLIDLIFGLENPSSRVNLMTYSVPSRVSSSGMSNLRTYFTSLMKLGSLSPLPWKALTVYFSPSISTISGNLYSVFIPR